MRWPFCRWRGVTTTSCSSRKANRAGPGRPGGGVHHVLPGGAVPRGVEARACLPKGRGGAMSCWVIAPVCKAPFAEASAKHASCPSTVKYTGRCCVRRLVRSRDQSRCTGGHVHGPLWWAPGRFGDEWGGGNSADAQGASRRTWAVISKTRHCTRHHGSCTDPFLGGSSRISVGEMEAEIGV